MVLSDGHWNQVEFQKLELGLAVYLLSNDAPCFVQFRDGLSGYFPLCYNCLCVISLLHSGRGLCDIYIE